MNSFSGESRRTESCWKSVNNTREQAQRIFEEIRLPEYPIILITSPEHLYRSLLSFRKVGFSNVGGTAAFEKALEEELTYRSEKLGVRKLPGPKSAKACNSVTSSGTISTIRSNAIGNTLHLPIIK